MKVGDRIRVFKIQDGYYEPSLIGKHSAEKTDHYLGNIYGSNICYGFINNEGSYIPHHINIDNDIVKVNHVKHVATMVITKIKES